MLQSLQQLAVLAVVWGLDQLQAGRYVLEWLQHYVLVAMLWLLGQVDVDPSADGLPGGVLIQKILNWGQMGALWASLAAVLGGAGYYGWSETHGSYGGAARGKKFVIGGAVGAIIAGLAPTIVNTLFNEVA